MAATDAVLTPTRRYTSGDLVIEETRYLFSQYRIEYNADFIIRATRKVIIEGPPEVVGNHQFSIDINQELSSFLVPNASKTAAEEGRILRSLSGAFELEVARG